MLSLSRRRRSAVSVPLAVLLCAACVSEEPADSCAGVVRPDCTRICAPAAFELCGTPCANEGEACGNALGDGMRCVDGSWRCTVHPPLP
jgi:hypothetical protein